MPLHRNSFCGVPLQWQAAYERGVRGPHEETRLTHVYPPVALCHTAHPTAISREGREGERKEEESKSETHDTLTA